jgi:tripartite-type tricarboxylate transporter receptor subunit TctC
MEISQRNTIGRSMAGQGHQEPPTPATAAAGLVPIADAGGQREGAMQIPRRQFLHLAAGVAAQPAVSSVARAQTYPTRPVTIVVPFTPGGGSDAIGRIVAERMRVSLGQPLVIENVGGANGIIGVGRAARAAPDGYTLVMGLWNTHVANAALYALSYDVLKDFEPISLLASSPLLITAKKTMQANDLKELIAWLKANPGRASQGIPGFGSIPHVAGVFLQNITGARYAFVPYRGSGAAMTDLLAGQIDLIFDTPPGTIPQMRAGTIKVFAVAAKSRLAMAPDIPTVDEAGLPGFFMSSWYALFAPNGTSRDIITKLNAAVVEALADSKVRSRLADQGQEIPARGEQTPEALGEFQKSEIEKWLPILKAAGIKTE